jgi:site-specific DNA-methyltransferase (cytosine-N4-specific)
MVATSNDKLKIIDEELIEVYSQLPVDFWDFQGWNVRSHVHGLHNYPATMVYPISRKIIETHKSFDNNLRTFFDPYMGSGTCIVEAILADFELVYGTDLNPLARLMGKVKANPIDPEQLSREITSLLNNIEGNLNELSNLISNFDRYVTEELQLDVADKYGWGANAQEITTKYLRRYNIKLDFPNISNLGYWFKPVAMLELQLIKNCIKLVEDNVIRNFFWLTFSETVRLSSNTRKGEFKMYRMTPEKVRAFEPNVYETFINSLNKNEEKMHEYWEACRVKNVETNVRIYNNDTRYLNDIPDNSIDLLITSPPYGDSKTTVAYGQYSRTSLEWLDLNDIDDDESLTEKEIRKIDSILLGGKVDRKNEFIYELQSDTLRSDLEQIRALDEKRAREVYQFYVDLDKSLGTITSKMKKNSYQYWVVGNRTVKGVKLLTHQILIELGAQYGLRHVTTLNRAIPNKVMPSRNSPTNRVGELVSTMTDEHILVFRKEE